MEVYIMDDRNQKINCTVESCRYNDCEYNLCELEQIDVKACTNGCTGKPQDESMCGSYRSK